MISGGIGPIIEQEPVPQNLYNELSVMNWPGNPRITVFLDRLIAKILIINFLSFAWKSLFAY